MLEIIQVGNDEASTKYAQGKIKRLEKEGLEAILTHIDENITTEELVDYLTFDCVSDAAVMVLLPLPPHIKTDEVLRAIPEGKDIDGQNPCSHYQPLTPCGIMRWLHEKSIPLEGRNVVVIGRGPVGKPLANMLIDAGATVTVCNSKTESLETYTRPADVVISAVGKAGLIMPRHVGNAHKQVWIDVGINRGADGKTCGDISAEAAQIIRDHGGECTPVPGGVGTWTQRELTLRQIEMESK